MIQVNEGESGGAIQMTVGDTLEVRLAANPTTGFRWYLAAEGAPACVAIDNRFESGGGPPGLGGTSHWRFRAVRAGEGRIELDYRRGWQKEAAWTFTLRAQVNQDHPTAASPS